MSTIVTRAGKGSPLTNTELDANFTNLNADKYQSGSTASFASVTLTTALTVGNGGSGSTTAQGAMNTFAGAVTAGQYLRGNGTNVVMSAIQAADVPTLNQNTTGTAAGLSATLAIASGGTAQTSFTANYIHYGAFSTSASLQFDGTTMRVGSNALLGGTTNPIVGITGAANNYIQSYIFNATNGASASSDFVAYASNSTDAHGWADMGFTGPSYADTVYTVTGPNEAYVFGSALNSTYTGNLVYATDSTGSANAHQWYVGGFTQAKSAWKMQLTSTGLQLANALGSAYGGTGLTAPGASGNVLTSNGTTWVSSAPAGGVTSFNTRTGAVTLSSTDVTTALTFTPYNATNPSGYITSSGTAANVSGIVAVANGGTGASSAATALTNLGAQATLVSGTNIKTINSTSILGAGNITVSASAAGSTNQVQYNSAGAFAGSINLTFDGTNLTCGGTVTANSDETIKTNWRDFGPDFIEQLAKIKNGTYDRIDIELTQDGVGAQSLQSLMPNSVLRGEDGKLSVAYGNAALVSAIQLAKRLVALEATVAKLVD